MGKYLVFDVGGTFTKYALMTEDGEVIEKHKYPTVLRGEGADAQGFAASVEAMYRRFCQDNDDIEGIAMSLPGQIDVDHGIVYGGGALGYLDEVNVGDLISKSCDGIRVALENDGKCAALAEVWKGNAKDTKDACVLIIGTGVGGGVIMDRKVHRGNRMLAGEFSFFISSMRREQLEGLGRLEDTVSLPDSFEKFSFLESSRSTAASLCHRAASLKGIKYEDMNGELIYRLAREGDKDMQELLEDIYFNIAKLCLTLYVAYDPDVILIGGGISAEPAFFEGIRTYVDRMKGMAKIYRGINIDICKFRNDSNLIGAIFNFKQKYNIPTE